MKLRSGVPTAMLLAALPTAAALDLSAFGADTAGSRSSLPSPAAPIKLKVVFVRYLSFAPLAIAKAAGYFQAQGLDVELVHFPGSSDTTPALLRGDIDVAAGQLKIADFNAIARGASIRIVADKGRSEPGPCTVSALVARPGFLDTKNPGSAEHIRGARISTHPLSQGEYLLETFLRGRGLRLSDMKLSTLPAPIAVEAIANGSLDFTVLQEPDLSRSLRSGRGVLLKPLTEILPGVQLATITYGPNLLQKNRDAGRRFMVAYLQGVREYSRGKTPRNLEILAEVTGLDREVLKAACWQPIRGDGMINVESILDFQRWAIERGALDALLPPSRFWDSSFAEDAVNPRAR